MTSVLSNIAQYSLLHSRFTRAALIANNQRQQLIGAVYLIMYLATVAAFACWIYRANKNARALGASGMQFGPVASVGWYFIPICCLWKPYQAMREIWKASKDPKQWQDQPTAPLLRWWCSRGLGVSS